MYPRNRPTVDHIVVMGNSTSDRGTFMKRTLFGFIPLRLLFSIFKKTHKDRFTNGYTWADNESAMLASKFLTDHLLKNHKKYNDRTDIADAVINHDKQLKNEISSAYHLNDDKKVSYKNTDFLRMYAEGGLTSAEYRCRFTFNPLNEVPRLIVSSLARQRNKLLADDLKQQRSALEKAHTLVVEWSGGNDLITVNTKPNMEIAKRAIEARIDNLMKLSQEGYKNFALITMPDLSLTPRFQAKSVDDQINAKLISDYFNSELTRRCELLKREMPELTIDIFDINTTLRDVIAQPEQYGFDKDKTHAEFIKSDEYKKNKYNTVLPASRYVFWDDVHPSAHIHAMLAAGFYDKFSKLYHIKAPDRDLVNSHERRKSCPNR